MRPRLVSSAFWSCCLTGLTVQLLLSRLCPFICPFCLATPCLANVTSLDFPAYPLSLHIGLISIFHVGNSTLFVWLTVDAYRHVRKAHEAKLNWESELSDLLNFTGILNIIENRDRSVNILLVWDASWPLTAFRDNYRLNHFIDRVNSSAFD